MDQRTLTRVSRIPVCRQIRYCNKLLNRKRLLQNSVIQKFSEFSLNSWPDTDAIFIYNSFENLGNFKQIVKNFNSLQREFDVLYILWQPITRGGNTRALVFCFALLFTFYFWLLFAVTNYIHHFDHVPTKRTLLCYIGILDDGRKRETFDCWLFSVQSLPRVAQSFKWLELEEVRAVNRPVSFPHSPVKWLIE